MIKTIRELKKAISNIDDDFTIDVRIVRELSEEELSGSDYLYPYEYTKANLEIGDIGYSDKYVFINVDEISDDVCEWKYINDFELTSDNHESKCIERCNYIYCPYCGKKIKIVGDYNG